MDNREKGNQIVATAKCIVCDKVVEIDEEMMKWLSDVTFKRNPTARGSRILEALSFIEGDNCIENGIHSFFDETWFIKTDEIAKDIKEKTTALDINTKAKERLEKRVKELNERLDKINDEGMSLIDEIPNLKSEFERITGTQKYEAWLKVEPPKEEPEIVNEPQKERDDQT